MLFFISNYIYGFIVVGWIYIIYDLRRVKEVLLKFSKWWVRNCFSKWGSESFM